MISLLTCFVIGNATETCGGPSRLNIYKLGDAPPPAGETSTSSTVSTVSTVSTSTTSNTQTLITLTTTTRSVTTTTSTTTSATATSTGPAVKEKVGNWDFQGCYLETENGRALTGKTLARDEMTLEMCGETCAGFTYFGVEYGRECYCGNTLKQGSVPAENQKDCSFLCPGDKTTFCGAGMRLQLYKIGGAQSTTSTTSVVQQATSTTTTSAPSTTSTTQTVVSESTSTTSVATSSTTTTTSVSSTTTSVATSTSTSTSAATSSTSTSVATTSTTFSTTTKATSTTSTTSARPTQTGPIVFEGNKNFTYYSCVQEPSSGRLLPRQIYNDGDNMTINSCLERCWNFNYAGVEYGRECWCGDKLNLIGNQGATPGKNVTDSQCSFLCPGDKNVYCGAGSKMNLYVRKDYKP